MAWDIISWTAATLSLLVIGVFSVIGFGGRVQGYYDTPLGQSAARVVFSYLVLLVLFGAWLERVGSEAFPPIVKTSIECVAI